MNRTPRGTAQDAPSWLRRRRIRHRLVWCAAGLWLLWVVATLTLATLALRGGRADARSLQRTTHPGDVASGQTVNGLQGTAREFGKASRQLGSPSLVPLEFLPVIGRQLRSTRALARAGSTGAMVAARAVQQASRELNETPHEGPARSQRIRRLLDIAEAAHHEIGGIRLGPSSALISPLARARGEASRQLASNLSTLDRALAALRASLSLLDGNHRILLLADNNAEMRAGMGMPLQGGVLTVVDGRLSLEPMRSIGGLRPPPGSVDLPAELNALWGSFAPGDDFRELFLAPRFDATAPVAARMWRALGQGDVDAVMAIDPVFLQAVLTVTGPVAVEGHTYDAASIVQVLLHDQYQSLPAIDSADDTARRQALGDVARAVFDRISNGGFPLGKLADAVSRASAGRHIMIWSADALAEGGWAAASAAGQLHPSSALVSVLNRGANKLDFFLPVSADVNLQPQANGVNGTITVHIANRTPPQEPAYVAGPNPEFPDAGLQAGTYRGIVQVNLPGQATSVAISGVAVPEIVGPDGPTWVIATPVEVRPGEERDVVIRFHLTGTRGELALEPAGRVPELAWSLNGRAQDGDHSHHVTWSSMARE